MAPAEDMRKLLEREKEYVQTLANASGSILPVLNEKPGQAAHTVARGVEIFIPLKGLIDLDKGKARLKKEL